MSWIGRIAKGFKLHARMPHEDDWTIWLVESDSRNSHGRIRRSEDEEPLEWLVDLLDFELDVDFNGSCNCEEFVFTLKPHIEAGETGGMPLRCKHIKRARSMVLGAILKREHQRRNWKPKGRKNVQNQIQK